MRSSHLILNKLQLLPLKWENGISRAVERRPFLVAAVMSALAIWAADGAWILGGSLLGVVVAVLLWVRPLKPACGLIFLALVAGSCHFDDRQHREFLRDQVGPGHPIETTVRVVETPHDHGPTWSAIVDDTTIRGRYWLRAQGKAPAKESVLQVKGLLKPIQAPRNPGEFDRFAWLNRLGVALELETRHPPDLVAPPPPHALTAEKIRAWFRQAITRGIDPQSEEASVIRAVVLGERPQDDDFVEPFRLTGTLHVFAVSGLHVGMVGLIGWIILRLCGVSRRQAILPLIALMFGYAWLTGMKPPALRAAWMAALWLGAFFFRRRPNLANALGLAALGMLMFDGDLLFKAGPQLSFGVVAVISLLHPHVSKLFAGLTVTEPYLPRSLYGVWRARWLQLRQKTADLLTLSTSAWIGSAPLTAWHFGILTPMAVLASAALSLLVFPLLGLALISVILSPLPFASQNINRANSRIAKLVLGTAEAGADVPGGHVTLPRNRPARHFVLVYDLGQDGASLWHLAGHTGLIDGGSSWSFQHTVRPSLERMALAPQSVIATHPDGKHVGGLAEASRDFPIKRAMAPVVRALGPGYRSWIESANAQNTPIVRGRQNQIYPVSEGIFFDVPFEPDPWNWHQLADDRVMPVRLHWHDWKLLFMSDAGWLTERDMMKSGYDFSADVIIAGRHAYDATLSGAFLDASGAQAVIVSHQDFPREQQIPHAWRAHCEARGIAVFHQGESGGVTISQSIDQLRLHGWLDNKRIVLTRNQNTKQPATKSP